MNNTIGIMRNDTFFQKDKTKNKNLRNQHWLANLAFECLESEYLEIKAGLFSLYESCIDILHIICTVKEDLQIYQFFLYDCQIKYKKNAP